MTEHDTCQDFILKEKLNANLRESEDLKKEYFEETGLPKILFGYEDTWWNSPRDLLNWFGLGNLFNWENSKNELEIERFSLKWGKFENRKSPEWQLSNEADVEKLIVHVHYFVGLYFIKLV